MIIPARHACDLDALSRVSALDATVRDPDDGVTDFLGYRCPQCGLGWVRMQYLLNGERTFSWKSAKELAGGL